MPRTPEQVRDWRGVPCRLWDGDLTSDGYGRETVVTPGGGLWVRSVHRAAYEAAIGRRLHSAETLDHLCGVRRCYEVAHLEMLSAKRHSNREEERARGSKPNGRDAP